ncbi:carbohydrate ABC transporter permease [Cohnella sp. LGH]|uniref:Putative aldouronate transport system permease protein n=2 Tax=Paenibacillaceae TaxID=186822 RepID=A0A3D9KCQ3_9BACL|nr:carbohydrate ABC transporter permease [Cohnella sp. LGH]RED83346.1 putative aldouronate transport system permease protein [Cohnella phaseoli]
MVGGTTMRQSIRANRGDRLYDAVNYTILTLLLLAVAYPLYFVIIASFSDPKLVASGKVLFWPRSLDIKGYIEVLNYAPIWTGYRNTLIYTTLFTALSVMTSLLAGYALSRKPFPGKTLVTAFLLFTMFFNGGLIPTYLLMKEIGLYGNPLVIVLLGAVNVTNIIISRTFIKSTIPDELFEAASMDGCSHFSFFFRIALPVSKALIAVLVLFAAVSQWNSWFNAMIYLRDQQLMPLQMVLRDLIVSQSAMSMASDSADMGGDAAAQIYLVEAMRYAVIIVSTLPIMCVYPFVQKYFVKGVMIGSVKG